MSSGDGGSSTRFLDVPSVPSASTPASLDLSYGDLRLGELVGHGGNGVVHEVTTPQGKRVALKRPHIAKGEARERFLAEAETWSHLTHRHIVRVHGWGVDPEPWIAMELADEGSLAERAGELRVDEALWTGVAIAEAVRYAHERGVMHYDLKPENVLLCSTPEGEWSIPKVTDWGLSELLLTQERDPKGLTYPYAAPEQFDQGVDVGRAADVYQLGATVYELLTGRPPVTGSRQEIVAQARAGDWPEPTSVNPSLPSGVDRVLAKALATDPSDRYADVLLFKRALESLFRDAHVTTTATHPRVTPRRTGVVDAENPTASPDERWQTELGAKPADSPVVVDGRAYVATVDGSVSVLELTSGAVVAEATLPGRPIAGPEIADGELHVVTDHPAHVHFETTPFEEGDAEKLSFSPRSALLVRKDIMYVTTDSNGLVAIDDGQVRWQAALPGNAAGLVAATPDHVVVTTYRGTTCFDVGDGSRRWTVTAETPHRATPAVTTDAAVVGGDNLLSEVDVRDGSERWRTSTSGAVTGIGLTADTVYAGTDEGSLHALDRADGRVRWERSFKGRVVNPPTVADETVVVGCTGQGRRSLPPRMEGVVAVDTDGRRRWAVAPGDDVVGTPVPVDDVVLFATADGTVTALQ